MGRTADCFKRLQDRGQKALISYAMAGYPSAAKSHRIICSMIKGGADIVEIGFPFSDPLADGHAIQRASAGALKDGMDIESYFKIVKKIRASHPDVPLFMMTYANILHSRGYEKICAEASSAGLDGFIIPDMSPEESAQYRRAAKKTGMDTVFLASPNTKKARMKSIALASTGFLYMVAVYGTTGSRSKIGSYTLKAIRNAKTVAGTLLPVGAGFGIKTAKDARKYADAGADAVIIGSAYVNIIENSTAKALDGRIRSYTRTIKAQLHSAGRKPK